MAEYENTLQAIGAENPLALTEANNEVRAQIEDAKTDVWFIRKKSTAYTLGNKVIVPGKDNYELILKCTTAGTTGSSVLDYSSLSIGDTINDGTVVWTVFEKDTTGGQGGGSVNRVNGKTGDVTLNNTDVDAAATSHTHDKSQITDFAHTHSRSDITDFSHNHSIANVTNLQSTLNSKAPTASPAFTGFPTSTTPPEGSNSTVIATTEFIVNLVGGTGFDPVVQRGTTANGWYRIYKSGWIEQGGKHTESVKSSGKVAITFPYQFATTDYTITGTILEPPTNSGGGFQVSDITASGCNCYLHDGGNNARSKTSFCWYACGQKANNNLI